MKLYTTTEIAELAGKTVKDVTKCIYNNFYKSTKKENDTLYYSESVKDSVVTRLNPKPWVMM